MVPVAHVVQAYEEVIVPYFWEHFTEEDSGNLVNEVDNFLADLSWKNESTRLQRSPTVFNKNVWNI